MISVIIVNYHSYSHTSKAVESVLQSEEDVEIIVVDNSATTEERSKLKELSAPEKIIVLFNKTNEGFAKACNKAYSISKGEFIFLLNPDAYILQGALQRLKFFLIANPWVGAVGPRIYWDDDRHFVMPPHFLPLPHHDILFKHRCRIPILTHLYALRWRWWSINVINSKIPLEQISLSGGSVLIRKSAIEASGGLFDEKFFLYYEDADLFNRLLKTGYKLYLDGRAEIVHNYNQSPEIKISKMEQLGRSHHIYMEKHFNKFYNRIIRAINKGKIFNKDKNTSDLVDLGKKNSPINVNVPDELKDGWLFEWSPNSNLFPLVIMFGKGNKFTFPETAWNLFMPGKYYGRFSVPNKFFVEPPKFIWRVC